VASSFHRFAMVAFAIQEHPEWRASDLELRYDAPSYTARTLNRFHERGYQSSELFFVIGADAFSRSRVGETTRTSSNRRIRRGLAAGVPRE